MFKAILLMVLKDALAKFGPVLREALAAYLEGLLSGGGPTSLNADGEVVVTSGQADTSIYLPDPEWFDAAYFLEHYRKGKTRAVLEAMHAEYTSKQLTGQTQSQD